MCQPWIYPPGPGNMGSLTTDPQAPVSHGLDVIYSVPQVTCVWQGLQAAPRRHHREHRQPVRLAVNINTAVKIMSFFIFRISHRNVSFLGQLTWPDNSTPQTMMCKCNR